MDVDDAPTDEVLCDRACGVFMPDEEGVKLAAASAAAVSIDVSAGPPSEGPKGMEGPPNDGPPNDGPPSKGPVREAP